MDVKHIVNTAKQYIVEIFADEKPINIGLEEVDYDESNGIWYVTIGFSRPWDEPKNVLAALAAQQTKRVFKILRISDATGKVLSIKNREVNYEPAKTGSFGVGR